VIKGEKHFTLLPPTDVPFLCEREFGVAQYVQRRQQSSAGDRHSSTASGLSTSASPPSLSVSSSSASIDSIASTATSNATATTTVTATATAAAAAAAAAADDDERNEWCIVPDASGARTQWIPVDLECPSSLRRHPRAARIAPLAVRARVRAGEVLYLPSMWFHRVAQHCGYAWGGRGRVGGVGMVGWSKCAYVYARGAGIGIQAHGVCSEISRW
jgi:hypothetical protein